MDFLRNKRVVVTGGAGFLGSSVVKQLEARGAQVMVPRSRDYDLTQPDMARRMYEDGRPQLLIHLAARVGGIGANQRNSGRFFHENMTMGLNVIEEGRRYGELEKLVFIGTTCSYPKFTPTPFREEDFWSGYPEETNAPYGIAKRSLLAMSWGYRQQYGMNIIYLIPANLYGPGDNFDLENGHVIPGLIRKFLEAKERGESQVVAWGTGSPSREFLYVEDAAQGIVLAAERYNKPDHVNLGVGHEVQIRDLVNLISKLVGYQGEVVWDTSRPNGQPRRCLNTSLALNEFGFQSATPLQEGLKKTIMWYLEHQRSARPLHYH